MADATDVLSDADKQKIRDALPPKFADMTLPELWKILQPKDIDNINDADLYPQVAKWKTEAETKKTKSDVTVQVSLKDTINRTREMLQQLPYTAPHFKSDPFFAELAVMSVASSIHEMCYDADYDFDYSLRYQPNGIVIIPKGSDIEKLEVNRNLFNTYKNVKDFQMMCKLTKNTCEKMNGKLKESSQNLLNDPDESKRVSGWATNLMLPLVYKRYEKCFLSEDRKGPKEGCFVMGPLKNMCDLTGFDFDDANGRCIFNEDTCSDAGYHYDKEQDRCWQGNLDYLFALAFSDAALKGAVAVEYKILKACKEANIPKPVCLMGFAKTIGMAAGITQAFVLSIEGLPDAMLDPDNGVEVLQSSWDRWLETAKAESGLAAALDFKNPQNMAQLPILLVANPLGVFKIISASLPLVINGILVGAGVAVGKMLTDVFGVDKGKMKEDAEKMREGFQDFGNLFVGKWTF